MVPLGYSGRLCDIQNERHYILKTDKSYRKEALSFLQDSRQKKPITPNFVVQNTIM